MRVSSFKSLLLAIGFGFFLGGNVLMAGDGVPFHLLYSPNGNTKCDNLAVKTIFDRADGVYFFNLALHRKEGRIPHQWYQRNYGAHYEFRIYSFSDLEGSDLPARRISWQTVMNYSRPSPKDDDLLTYKFSLNPPYSYRRTMVGLDDTKLDFFNWNVVVVLYDKKEDKPLYTQSYSIKLLPRGILIYGKIQGESEFYSTEAKVDSELIDNHHGFDIMGISYEVEESERWKKLTSLGNVGFGADTSMLRGNFDFRPFGIGGGGGGGCSGGGGDHCSPSESNGGGIDGGGGHAGGGGGGGGACDNGAVWKTCGHNGGGGSSPFKLMVDFAIKVGHTKETIVVKEHRDYVRDRFFLLPGESGIIYSQDHYENALFRKYGADECGVLKEIGTERKKVMHLIYSLLLVDLNRMGESSYLNSLSQKFLPPYHYYKVKTDK